MVGELIFEFTFTSVNKLISDFNLFLTALISRAYHTNWNYIFTNLMFLIKNYHEPKVLSYVLKSAVLRRDIYKSGSTSILVFLLQFLLNLTLQVDWFPWQINIKAPLINFLINPKMLHIDTIVECYPVNAF